MAIFNSKLLFFPEGISINIPVLSHDHPYFRPYYTIVNQLYKPPLVYENMNIPIASGWALALASRYARRGASR